MDVLLVLPLKGSMCLTDEPLAGRLLDRVAGGHGARKVDKGDARIANHRVARCVAAVQHLRKEMWQN